MSALLAPSGRPVRQAQESVLIGVCYECGCNFTRPTESVSRQIFQRLSEMRSNAMNPLIAQVTGSPINEQDEEMIHGAPAGQPPVRPRRAATPAPEGAVPPPGPEGAAAPTAPGAPEGAVPPGPEGAPAAGNVGDPAGQPGTLENWLHIIKQRFVDERVQGFTNPRTGEVYPPVPHQEAEARWLRQEPRFREYLQDPATLDELNGRMHGQQAVPEPQGAPMHPVQAPMDAADTEDLPEGRTAAEIAQAKLDE